MALRFTIIDQFGTSHIIDEPVGWDAINLHYIRHKDWHGFIDTIDDTMGSLQFYGDGYQLLSAAFTSYGVEAACGFLVEYQCDNDAPADGDTSWDTIYQGQFSFYKYKEVQGMNGCHVECSVESATNVMVLKNRYEQKVDLGSLVPFQTPASPLASVLAQIQALSTTITDPGTITTLTVGDTYLVPAGTSAWGGPAGDIAVRTDSGWTYTTPQDGQVLIDMSTHLAYVYSAASGTWGPYTALMSPYSPALGGMIPLPSKTIELITSANVAQGEFLPGGGSTPSPSGGSSFTLDNSTQSVQSMQLSWIGGVVSNAVPGFAGADPDLWIGKNIGDPDVDADPIFVYSPDPRYTAAEVSVDIQINGTIAATATNGSNPVDVQGMSAVLCYGAGSYQSVFAATDVQAITLSGAQAYYEGASITFSWGYNGTITIPPGTNVYLVFEFDFSGRGTNPTQYAQVTYAGSATFTIDSSYPDTAAPVYLVCESLSRIAEAVTDDQIRVYSDFFGRIDSLPYSTAQDGEGGLLCITNGLLIRGQPLLDGTQPPMSVSLKELYEALCAIYNIGMAVEPDPQRTGYYRLRIEPMAYFYPPAVVLTCTDVDEISIENQQDRYVGIFRTGYDKWQGEQSGGLDDFMTKREYRTALSTSRTVLEKYCGFIASSYAIETTRRLSGTSTQDWRFDHENFLICLDRSDLATAVVAAVGYSQTPEPEGVDGGYTFFYQVTGVSFASGGMGYSVASPPQVHIYGGGTYLGSLTAIVSSGAVTGVSSTPIIARSYPSHSSSPPASGISIWHHLTATIDSPINPNAAGSGASATATVGQAIAGGPFDAIQSISVINGGSNYSVIPPTVNIPAPSAGGVQATAVASVIGGALTGVNITNNGSGYNSASPPIITFGNPPIQLLDVEQGAIQNPTNTVASANIVDPTTLYNFRISPLRNAMRWLRTVFQSYADWMGGILYFVSGEANIRATGQYSGILEAGTQIVPVMENAPMSEDQDIAYSDFSSPAAYYPIYTNKLVKYTYPLSYADWLAVSANPYGRIAYSVNGGSTRYGWIEELKYNPFEGTAEFTLKAAA
jgi:hypothetical protein